jgi:hypothetical protein
LRKRREASSRSSSRQFSGNRLFANAKWIRVSGLRSHRRKSAFFTHGAFFSQVRD